MADLVVSSVSECVSFVKTIQRQAQDISEIKVMMDDQYPPFMTALTRLSISLEMLSSVFERNSEEDSNDDNYNKLFEYNNLKFSQIDTIKLKLSPIQDLFNLLGDLYYENNSFCDKLRPLFKLYIKFKKPSTVKQRLRKHFKEIEELLPKVVELKRTIFGSAQRIRHPVLRKAWMLSGENQLNDSSLPSNIIQDNLYMLLNSEIGDDIIDKWKIKKTFKDGISQIVDDIDNRGTTKGDSHISIAELNDLPDVMYSYLSPDEINDDTYYSFSSKTKQKSRGSRLNRYLCIFTKNVCPDDSADDSNEENNDDNIMGNRADNTQINVSKDIDFNNAQTFFEKYTEYLQETSFSKKRERLEVEFKLLETKRKIKLAEKNHSDVTQYTQEFHDLQSQANKQEEQDAQDKLNAFNVIQKIQPPKYSNPTNISLIMKYIEGNPQMNAGVPRENKQDLDDNIETQNVSKGHILSNTRPTCVSDSGNEYPCIKIASEDIQPEKYVPSIDLNKYVLTNICFKIIAFDQNRGATGKVHIRYQINDGKCIKACTIMRQRKKKSNKNAQNRDTYTFNINGHEMNKNRKNVKEGSPQTISLWLFCPEEKGWSATVKSIIWEHKYKCISN